MFSELQTQINDLKNSTTKSFTKEEVIDDILAEMREQKIRESNIIIKNLPEKDTADEDRTSIDNVINQVTEGIKHDYKMFRIGQKRTDSTPRMVKVIFNNKTSAQVALNNSGILRKNVLTKNVYINHDFTPKQSAQIRKTFEEFNKRKNDGENILIRYADGFPKIVIQKNA